MMARVEAVGGKKGLAALAGAVLMALVPGACGGGQPQSGGPVTITFANWADAETATRPGIEAMIAQFEKQNPGVTVKSVPIAFSDIGHQLLLQNTSGNPPDVAEIAGNDWAALAEANALQPLDGLLSSSFTGSLIPTERGLGEYQGHLTAVPWTVAPFGLWYNRALMSQAGLDASKPPQTLDQLLTDLQTVKSKLPGVIPLGVDTTNRAFGLDVNWPLMLDFGARPIDNGRANAGTPQMIQYLQFMNTLGTKGYTVPDHLIGYFRPLCAQNKVVFQFDGPYLQGVIQSDNHMNDADFYKTWGVEPWPAGASGRHYSVPTDHQLVIFKRSPRQPAAAKFVEWLAGSDQAITGYTFKYESSLPPVQNATAKFPQQMSSPVYQAFLRQIVPVVVRPPWGGAYTSGYSTIMSGVQTAVGGSQPIGQVQATMQSELSSKLAS
jgi:multiple sugar transport system substrate-binding protein